MSCIHPWYNLKGNSNRNTPQGAYALRCTACSSDLTKGNYIPADEVQRLRRVAFQDQTGRVLRDDTPIDIFGNVLEPGNVITFPSDRSLAIAEILDVVIDDALVVGSHYNYEYWRICRTHVNAPTMIKAQRIAELEGEYRVSTLTSNASNALFLAKSWVSLNS